MIWLVTDVALGRSSDCLSPIYSDAAKWPLSYGRLFFEGRAWCGNITRQVERGDARGAGKGIPPDHVPCAMWMPLPEIRTQSFWQYCPDGCFSLSHIENGHSLSPFSALYTHSLRHPEERPSLEPFLSQAPISKKKISMRFIVHIRDPR